MSEKGKIQGLKLKYRAYHDALTGAKNRYALEDKINEEINNKREFILLKIDINNFHHLNDTLGLVVGDKILKKLFLRLEDMFQNAIIISRFGNDEFYILYNLNDANNKINNLIESLKKPYKRTHGDDMIVTCSIGVIKYPDDASSLKTLIRYSSIACEKAKLLGGNSIIYFDKSMAKDDEYKLLVQHHVQYALKNNEFYLNFQPKFTAKKPHKIMGMEVLIRWESPTLGKVSPAVFIPIIEQLGLVSEVGHWVFVTALKEFKKWETKGIIHNDTEISISINFAVPQIQKQDSFDIINKTILEIGLDSKYLEVEVTESILMNDKTQIINSLQKLKDCGISIAMDDFGTGYSSFGYLQEIPLTSLKIDKIFIDDIEKDSRIVKSIISLAHQLNLKVIAEGVENKEQLEILSKIDCDYIQGYYFSAPISADKMQKLILDQ